MLFSIVLLVLNGFFGGLSASLQTVVAVAISHRGSYLEEPPVATTALARVRFSLGGCAFVSWRFSNP